TISASATAAITSFLLYPRQFGFLGPVTFTVLPAPTILPAAGNRSTTASVTVNVTINGVNFLQGSPINTTLTISGTGVSIGASTITATKITTSLTIAAGAATGPRTITVASPISTSTLVFTVN